MNRAVIYCRISDDKSGEGLGVERQEKDCRALARKSKYRVVAPALVDNDISAYSGKRRPAYQDLLRMIEAGEVDVVLAWHSDRLHRSPLELEEYINAVNKHDVSTEFVTSGFIDLTTPTGRMMARQVGIFARYESEHRAERIARKHRESAEAGRYRGGTTRIFGYEADGLTPHPAEAEAIRGAYAAIIEGRSLGSIMRDWEARGIRTVAGKQFGHVTFKQVLQRKRNYGASVYKGEVVGVGQWEPLTDEATWRKVNAILNDPSRKKNTTNKGKHLMSGLMRCAKCEAEGITATVKAVGIKQKDVVIRYYRCATAAHNNIKVAETDQLVTDVVLGILTRKDSPVLKQARVSPGARPAVSDLPAQAEKLRSRLDSLLDMFTDGEINRAQHAKASAKVRAELSAIEGKMATQGGSKVLADVISADDVTAAWEALEWKQKREIISALMTVYLLPSKKGYVRRYQPERIRFDWVGTDEAGAS